jgi:hypothetical protein
MLVFGLLLMGFPAMSGRAPGALRDDTRPETRVVPIDGESVPDLPCPWCLSPTAETDRCCPTCGQPFGRFSPPRTPG